LGNFNFVLNQVSYNEFLDWTNRNNITNMAFSGPYHTWFNGRRGLKRIDRKIDRTLCNEECLDEWSSSTYQVLVKNCFDHSPILASLSSINYLHRLALLDSLLCGFRIKHV